MLLILKLYFASVNDHSKICIGPKALRWSLFLRVNLLWTKFRIFLFYLLFKKSSRSEAANYRPVSSTSVPCKYDSLKLF